MRPRRCCLARRRRAAPALGRTGTRHAWLDVDRRWRPGSRSARRPQDCVCYRNDRGRLDATSPSAARRAGRTALPAAWSRRTTTTTAGPICSSCGRPATRLLHQRADGRFEDVTGAAKVGGVLRRGCGRAAFVDVDHDGDLDLLRRHARPAPGSPANQLLRNNGDGTFTDITAAAKVGGAGRAAIARSFPTDFDNRRDIDLLVVARGAARRRSSRTCATARSATSPATSGLPRRRARSPRVAAGDVNKDGFTDFFFGRAGRPGTLALSDGRGRFTRRRAPAATRRRRSPRSSSTTTTTACSICGARGRTRCTCCRNVGPPLGGRRRRRGLARAAGAPFQAHGDRRSRRRRRRPTSSSGCASGELRIWRNDGGSANRSLRVQLTGRVSNRGGVGSKVELRAGSLRQRLETSAATPAVGAGRRRLRPRRAHRSPTPIRVLWPSGILQTEVTPAPADDGSRSPRTLVDHRARSQAVVVSVPLHVERHAVRVRDRLHGRRRDGLLGRRRATGNSPTPTSTCASAATS